MATPHYRGERNNNPLNLKRTTPPIPWLGLAAPIDQAGDVVFDVFVDPQHGIRAAALDMQTHALRLTSSYSIPLDQLVSIWAPALENDTQAYIVSVSEHVARDPANQIVTNDMPTMIDVVAAFIKHENSRCIYPPALITEGLKLLPNWHTATKVSFSHGRS